MSKQKQLNRTALYMRLSRDDEKAGESMSIENQRVILKKYAEENGRRRRGRVYRTTAGRAPTSSAPPSNGFWTMRKRARSIPSS